MATTLKKAVQKEQQKWQKDQSGKVEIRADLDAASVFSLNDRFGRGPVALASTGLAGDRRTWVMKQDFKTPNYTTHWADMLVAQA